MSTSLAQENKPINMVKAVPKAREIVLDGACYANLDGALQNKKARIWAIGAIHGDVEELKRLHAKLARRIQTGDVIVYLGNYFGHGRQAYKVLSELLNFRIWFLSGTPYQSHHDLVYLRGAQEEMLAKILLLEHADQAEGVLNWMESRGMPQLLEGFGLSWSLLQIATHVGGNALLDWTKAAKIHLHALTGCYEFIASLQRAAYSNIARIALVNSGFDPNQPLLKQDDALWWNWQQFEQYEHSHENFRLVVRGYDPLNRGLARGVYRLCVDGGAGRGGELYGTLISSRGVALQWL